MDGIFEEAAELAKEPGYYDDGGIMLGDNEPVEKPADVVKSAKIMSGHSMTLRSHKNSSLQVNTANEAPKKDVMTDVRRRSLGTQKISALLWKKNYQLLKTNKRGCCVIQSIMN